MINFLIVQLTEQDRVSILSGKPPSGELKDVGKTFYACFNLGVNTLIETIPQQSLTTPEQVGEILSAGTNCGSCVPETREIIQQENKNNI